MPAEPTSNLLAIPLVLLTVATGTNEDWVDSLLFLVDDGSASQDDYPQLDLSGIQFDMEVRKNPSDNEVAFRASTEDNTLSIGDPPNFGYLLINIDHQVMRYQAPGFYVADIVGKDDAGTERRIVSIELEIVYGITRP